MFVEGAMAADSEAAVDRFEQEPGLVEIDETEKGMSGHVLNDEWSAESVQSLDARVSVVPWRGFLETG